MTRKITIYAIALTVGLTITMSGCQNWLDVTPASTLEKDELLRTEQGFDDVLHGVYIRLTENNLYGRELSYGLLDALAQYYDNIPNTPQHRYAQDIKFNYESPAVLGRINGIWTGLYRNIASCNVILSTIDERKSIFTGDNYQRIKAEALALRAWMHFDLLRLFAPAYTATTANAKGIPYVDHFTSTAIPFSSVSEVYGRIKADFEAARGLLHDFDIAGPVDTQVDGTSVFPVSTRKHWMNYYAITGLLARLSLYTGDYAGALQYFGELTTEHSATKFDWAQATQFYYYYYARERIFGLSIILAPHMNAKYDADFNLETASANSILRVSLGRTLELYETDAGGGTDYRYLAWLSKTEDNYIIKYGTLPSINVMTLAEGYLIAAESAMHTDPGAALDLLNTLRSHRGIPLLPGTADLEAEITKEYQKGFLGEGQLFHYYKRKGFQHLPGFSGTMTDSEYIFPLPDNEIEFNQ